MAVRSSRALMDLKKGHFERENDRIQKYTLSDELPKKISELAIRPLGMSVERPNYKIRVLTKHDKEKVLEFLRRRFFFQDEPMNRAVKLLETPESRCMELEEYAASTLDEEVSVAAVDESGEIVGLVINGIVHKKNVCAVSEKSEECGSPKFQRILNVLKYLDENAKIWEKLSSDCKSVMEVRIASTHSSWRGRGLMRVLCDESEKVARELGVSAMRMDTTSAFSAAAAEKLLYRYVYKTTYAEIPDAPQPSPPHTEARVYVKEL